jgi:integrase/recombinase XerD
MKLIMKNYLKNEEWNSEMSVVKSTNRHLEIRSEEFRNYLSGYEQWLRVLGYAASTVYYFPSYLRSFMHFLEMKGILKVKRIKSTHIRWFVSSFNQKINSQTGKTLSRNYQLNHLNAIKRFSKYLLDCHGIIMDCSIRVPGCRENEKIWLSRKEIELLFSSCKDDMSGTMNRAILSVYYGLGLRRSEGVGLDIDDICPSNGTAYIRKGKFNKERYVPMTISVFHDIEMYISHIRPLQVKDCKCNEEQALFISERGQRIKSSAIYERLQFIAKNAGLRTPLSLHSLRHSIATHLLEAGMSLENISSFLGHRSLESTQIYTHLLNKSI